MQSQGSAKTFTLYFGGIKAERHVPGGAQRGPPKSRDLNLGKSADQMKKRLCLLNRRRILHKLFRRSGQVFLDTAGNDPQ